MFNFFKSKPKQVVEKTIDELVQEQIENMINIESQKYNKKKECDKTKTFKHVDNTNNNKITIQNVSPFLENLKENRNYLNIAVNQKNINSFADILKKTEQLLQDEKKLREEKKVAEEDIKTKEQEIINLQSLIIRKKEDAKNKEIEIKINSKFYKFITNIVNKYRTQYALKKENPNDLQLSEIIDKMNDKIELLENVCEGTKTLSGAIAADGRKRKSVRKKSKKSRRKSKKLRRKSKKSIRK